MVGGLCGCAMHAVRYVYQTCDCGSRLGQLLQTHSGANGHSLDSFCYVESIVHSLPQFADVGLDKVRRESVDLFLTRTQAFGELEQEG